MLLDVTDRLVVIIGGGAVAARKAAGVISAGALRVRCVAPRFCPDLPQTVERIESEYSAHHLDGAGLVFAATDQPTVNAAVVRDCRDRDILVCRADGDESERGDFITPAKFQEGSVIVAVSAGGSPALAVKLRDQIARSLDRRVLKMAEALRTLRPLLRSNESLTTARRAQALCDLAREEAVQTLDRAGIDGLRAWLREKYPEIGNV